ncbi:MAG: 4-hydroxy-3-methylbut-2-en-1-yl diphosphate synthase [Prevotella sp.]|jgi:(E)-4-hydroxy-3-methylbut-2-enyl-diphosphate synthase|nr:4-hydroxy-3-methylbut-2-en-1-yl diphosphate synthase [Prevotella sp.]MCH4182241.1 4-hydroxy-3-methylbut-2-en-1-yl diphosphate synthase [Prevotella sp.]MCH4211206.1 4-hydroxy-3-methylbut-2-en-1-yl diphosphate synthase [Prevotella sp.]MCH4241206.1 4-hydroxy-3-methylbut-2-en-1-yl diphosphate synthase [Prevotella sp.]
MSLDLFNYNRRETNVIHVGVLDMGGNNLIRIQSMTTTSTDDTKGSVAQAERIIKAGGELVRLTTQGKREAENLKNIKAELLADGYSTPLVADVHFVADVADTAAQYAEGVRINPGNYVDPARRFIKKEYTDEEYTQELQKIEDRFIPFLNICRKNHTAIRIGVNNGSLSDRIRNRYGDTPEGIVESCMEFLRICKKQHFNDVVISIKASNTVVMVHSVRLLVAEMEKEHMKYPLHLGVTEAGDGEDGRIKSAVGIGALLADGIGDTVRVSLSEEPEAEIPVARHLVNYITMRTGHVLIPATQAKKFNWINPKRRETKAVENIGGDQVPVVIGKSTKADYWYTGSTIPEHPVPQQKYIIDYNKFGELQGEGKLTELEKDGTRFYPIFPVNAMPFMAMVQSPLKFLVLQFGTPAAEYLTCLKYHPEAVVICMSHHKNRLGDQRALVHEMWSAGLKNPVIFSQMYSHSQTEKEDFQIESAADMGALMMDGLTDGIWLLDGGDLSDEDIVSTAFDILQAGRLRTSKTEYISCPGCGRTLYDLQGTISKIKKATKDMKGLKIGIMGCIVNGPGEMHDADYGYVGAGFNRISLYRKQVCVEKNIPEEDAVDHLLALIRKDKEKRS